MARPRMPWAITIHRTKAESTNHDATPVTKATTSSTSSARFVRRPATTRSCHRTGGRAADPIPVAREMAPRDPGRIDSARTTSNISGRGPDVVHRHRTRAADTAARSAAGRSGTAAAHRATLRGLGRQGPGDRPHQTSGGVPRDRPPPTVHGRAVHRRARPREPAGGDADRPQPTDRPGQGDDLRGDGAEPLPRDGAAHRRPDVHGEDLCGEGPLRPEPRGAAHVRDTRQDRVLRRAAGRERSLHGDEQPGDGPGRSGRASEGDRDAHRLRAHAVARARGLAERAHRRLAVAGDRGNRCLREPSSLPHPRGRDVLRHHAAGCPPAGGDPVVVADPPGAEGRLGARPDRERRFPDARLGAQSR